MKRFRIAISALCILLANVFLPITCAQDAVVIKTPDGRKTKRTGEIRSWQGDSIILLTGTRQRTIASKDVLEIQTTWPISLKEARTEIANNNYPKAISKFRQAVSETSRAWIKAIINAELIQAYDAIENPSAAAKVFLEIYQDDPNTRFFDLIPLAWSIGEIQPPSSSQADFWMNDRDNPASQLIGASWQLPQDSRAISLLEQLSDNDDKRIAQLAFAQLWRTRSLSPTKSDVERWQRQLNRIDIKIRSGPLTVFAMSQKKLGMNDEAMINLLKVPILYRQKKSLAAFALYQTGSIMDDIGKREKAKNLWRELINDYPASQFAEFARGKL